MRAMTRGALHAPPRVRIAEDASMAAGADERVHGRRASGPPTSKRGGRQPEERPTPGAPPRLSPVPTVASSVPHSHLALHRDPHQRSSTHHVLCSHRRPAHSPPRAQAHLRGRTAPRTCLLGAPTRCAALNSPPPPSLLRAMPELQIVTITDYMCDFEFNGVYEDGEAERRRTQQ